MSDEPIIDDLPTEDATKSSEEWVMPKPVFRTSEGHTPSSAKSAYSDDLPTEIANRDESEFAKAPSEADTLETETTETDDGETTEDPVAKAAAQTTPKAKGGCAKSFLFIVSMIGLAVVAIIIALIYFLFYYQPAETGTF